MPVHPVDVGVALYAHAQEGNCSVAQVLQVGGDHSLIRRRVRSGRWLRRAPAVIGLADFPHGPRSDLWAAVLDAGAEAMASHDASAALHEVGNTRLHEPSVLVRHGSHHVAALGTVHQTRRFPTAVLLGGIPATPIVRTVLDLAPTRTPLALGRIVDEVALRRPGDLDAIVRGHEWMVRTRRAGSVNLGQALHGRTHGYVPARSELERLLDVIIATLPVAPPRREVDLPNREQVPHRVDRLFDEQRVIVEADGRLWHARMAAMEEDKRRDRRALLQGYSTVRYGWHELHDDAAEVRAELLELLVRRSV